MSLPAPNVWVRESRTGDLEQPIGFPDSVPMNPCSNFQRHKAKSPVVSTLKPGIVLEESQNPCMFPCWQGAWFGTQSTPGAFGRPKRRRSGRSGIIPRGGAPWANFGVNVGLVHRAIASTEDEREKGGGRFTAREPNVHEPYLQPV
jgi:hypothetical protein